MFDFAMVKTVPNSDLRRVSATICNSPVLAVKCCLQSWVGKDEMEAQLEYGAKIKKLMEEYGNVEVEVLEKCDKFMKIKIESVENKLLMKEPAQALSRAELLKMKLKSVK